MSGAPGWAKDGRLCWRNSATGATAWKSYFRNGWCVWFAGKPEGFGADICAKTAAEAMAAADKLEAGE